MRVRLPCSTTLKPWENPNAPSAPKALNCPSRCRRFSYEILPFRHSRMQCERGTERAGVLTRSRSRIGDGVPKPQAPAPKHVAAGEGHPALRWWLLATGTARDLRIKR